MKKRNLSKQMVGISLMIFVNLILPQTVKGAVLQANPTTNASPTLATAANWLKNVRNMETSGQAMGLTEIVDSTTLNGTTENGIDVHMMKNTEYGAVAILSASGVGNPSNEKTIDTTTGNKTGVYMQTTNYEFVAGAGSSASGMSGTTLAHRYFNTYAMGANTQKPGDALDLQWHSSSCSWLSWSYSYNDCGYIRGGSLGIFGYQSSLTNKDTSKRAGRAVVVSSAGL